MPKVLFINAPLRMERVDVPSPLSFSRGGLRAAITAAYLRRHDIGVDILDAAVLNLSVERAAQRAADTAADLMVISTNPYSVAVSAALASKVKQYRPGVRVVFEGPFVTALPETTLEMYRSVDYGLVGEPEEPLVGLCGCLDRPEQAIAVPGLVLRDHGQIVVTEEPSPAADLDELPLPAWDLLPDPGSHYRPAPPLGNSERSMCLITSRGMPGRRLRPGAQVNPYRAHTSLRIFEMMQQVSATFRVEDIAFVDAAFLLDEKKVVELCQHISRAGLRVTWSCLTSADHYISEFGLRRMAEAGCRQILLQIDSGSEAILRRQHKASGPAEIVAAIERIRAAGIEAHGQFTIGVPGENEATLAETEAFILRSSLDHIAVQFFRPAAGAARTLEALGVLCDAEEPAGDLVHFLPRGLSRESLLRTRAEIIRKFYKRDRAPRGNPYRNIDSGSRGNLLDAARKMLGVEK
ncbi:MAG: cobalamin-dependent protein [Deltaproteobacteria bacterium]|nr:cobalamin-dependent protein [Deltaproteobacteria bacterium]